MHGLLNFGSDKNAFVAIGFSVPGAWSSGPLGMETCDFGGIYLWVFLLDCQ